MTSTHQEPKRSEDRVAPFKPDDKIILRGRAGLSILDPEFSPSPSKLYSMAYEQNEGIWVARMDPLTGVFIGADQIPCRAASFGMSGFQGPEWGYNAKGETTLFFTVLDDDEKPQIAYSRALPAAWSDPTVLTDGGRMGATPSRNGTTSTQVNYTRWDTSGDDQPADPTDRQFYWMDIIERTEHAVEGSVKFHSNGPHFLEPLEGSAFGDLLFGRSDANGFEQVVRYDTRPGVPDNERAHFLTSLDTDVGHTWNHWDPDFLFAPEFGGALVYVTAVVEQDEDYPSKIAIYKASSNDPYGNVRFIRTLEIPERARKEGYTSIRSVEPIETEKASFVCLRLVNPNAVSPNNYDSSIWIWSLDGSLQRRVSSFHRIQGDLRAKDPEYLLGGADQFGTSKLFIYYSVYHLTPKFKNSTADLHLCETGVTADGRFTPGPMGA